VCRDTDEALRVLVVDDHPIWRDGLAEKLAERGSLVGTAADGAQALPLVPLAGLVLGEYRRLGTAPEPGTPRLTARETELLRLVAKDLTYPEIAERLVLSRRTVQNHVQNTLDKLRLHNKAQLVRYALEQGID
jgi:DNA-binding NarL/FixJ family response regulator